MALVIRNLVIPSGHFETDRKTDGGNRFLEDGANYDQGMTLHIPHDGRRREMSDWLTLLFPEIRPAFIADDGCWIASMMTRSADHNLPWAWVGWAFDAVSEKGGFTRLQERMIEMHGDRSCGGQEVFDEAARLLASATCAAPWSLQKFGSSNLPRLDGTFFENSASCNWVVSTDGNRDFAINVVRLQPANTQQEIVRQVIDAIEVTELNKPEGLQIFIYMWIFGMRVLVMHTGLDTISR